MCNTLIMDFPIYDSFPHNENQKLLHLSEKRYLENIEEVVRYSNKSPKEKKIYRDTLLAKVHEIKAQNPHPAKVLSPYPHYFWDCDVYWLHWDWDKDLIIPRMLGIDLDKEIEILESIYTKEEIIDTMQKTCEVLIPGKFEFLSNRYGVKITEPIHKTPAFFAL